MKKYKVENVSRTNMRRRFKKSTGTFNIGGERYQLRPGDVVVTDDISAFLNKPFTSFSVNPRTWSRSVCYLITPVGEQEEYEAVYEEPIKKITVEKSVPKKIEAIPEKAKEGKPVVKKEEIHEPEYVEAELFHGHADTTTEEEVPPMGEPLIITTEDNDFEEEDDFIEEELKEEDKEPDITFAWLVETGNLSRILEVKRKYSIKVPGWNSMSINEKAKAVLSELP